MDTMFSKCLPRSPAGLAFPVLPFATLPPPGSLPWYYPFPSHHTFPSEELPGFHFYPFFKTFCRRYWRCGRAVTDRWWPCSVHSCSDSGVQLAGGEAPCWEVWSNPATQRGQRAARQNNEYEFQCRGWLQKHEIWYWFTRRDKREKISDSLWGTLCRAMTQAGSTGWHKCAFGTVFYPNHKKVGAFCMWQRSGKYYSMFWWEKKMHFAEQKNIDSRELVDAAIGALIHLKSWNVEWTVHLILDFTLFTKLLHWALQIIEQLCSRQYNFIYNDWILLIIYFLVRFIFSCTNASLWCCFKVITMSFIIIFWNVCHLIHMSGDI